MFWNKLKKYNKTEQRAIVTLLGIIVILQLGFYFYTQHKSEKHTNQAKENWLSNQSWLDSLNKNTSKSVEIKPFNPNYITDFKGYQLGLTPQEIDRLLAYRATGKFINSVEEFQKITLVSDTVLNRISPYFKFPDFIHKNKSNNSEPNTYNYSKTISTKKIDLNHANAEDLIKVKGIGKVLSERIIKYRILLGGFVHLKQLHQVYGLEKEVIDQLSKTFEIKDLSNIKKININRLSSKELAQFAYFDKNIAESIVIYRSKNGMIQGKEDLVKILDFPIDKIDIILVYLEF